jgi:hypothetical protein
MVHLLWAHDLTNSASAFSVRPHRSCHTAAAQVLHGGARISALVVRFSWGELRAGVFAKSSCQPRAVLGSELRESGRGYTN